MANRLAGETSPYLLQHAENPVDWYPWGEEAFRAAKSADKPILLSIGYSACHWCHVMAHESFEDAAVAAQLNRDFVSVKVDREERPEVDQVYQGVVQLMGRGGGWPLTVVLTPDLKPFFGGTYFPKADRWGMPGFARVLDSAARAWRERREEVLDSAEHFSQGLQTLAASGLGDSPRTVAPEDIVAAGEGLAEEIDLESGGFAGAPKFPSPAALSAVLRAWRRGGSGDALRGVLVTLDRMAEGGIRDHLGGGFHRYSVDAHWAVPHFEKMLYDNAQLLALYAEAFQITRRERYAEVARELVGWLAREMTSPEGGFYSSQDADSEGEEGRFFVFTPEEVEEACGPELAELAASRYGVDERGNFEGGSTVLSLVADPAELSREHERPLEEIERDLATIRERLFAWREQRVRPGRDDKILTGWNGLMIGALSRASRVFDEPAWAESAARAADFLLGQGSPGGRLMRTFKDGRARIPALLEDYGDLAEGLVELYQATFEPRFLAAAARLADEALAIFWDQDAHAFRCAPKGNDALPAVPFAVFDNAWPSGASTLTSALVSLAGLCSRPAWLDAASVYLARMRTQMVERPFGFGRLLCAADAFLDGAPTLVVAGEPGPARRLLAEAARRWLPTVIAAYKGPQDASELLAATFEGKAAPPGEARAFLCHSFACEPPSADASVVDRLARSAEGP